LRTATPEQKQAIDAKGNVLVVAGAGAGKTSTLVARCLAWLLENENNSVDEILMVTFTQAAAAEMRQRLRAGLEGSKMADARLAEQLALLETAQISTLHSFCFRLVSQHFYELGLDPQLKVLSGEEAEVLARQTLDAVLEEIYASETPPARAIQQFIKDLGSDWDQPVRETVRRVHAYCRTLRDPASWLAAKTAFFQCDDPKEWRARLIDALIERKRAWLDVLERQPPVNTNSAACATALNRLPANPTIADFAAALKSVLEADNDWPPRKKTALRKPIEHVFDEAAFLHSLCPAVKGDPLTEDWAWARMPMLALLDAAIRFEDAFARGKRRGGALDYQDLEQFALKLLWDGDRPSAIAKRWREKLRLVFVDEFQDINGAQESIIQALSGEDAAANRFLVGDVKQSIYRFRLADPGIFLRYKFLWEQADDGGSVLGLSQNFRSHEGILNFVNALFATLMRESLGGVAYDDNARLRFGSPETRGALAADAQNAPPVELHLRRTSRKSQDDDGENASENEREARMVCRRLMELKEQNFPIIDGQARRAMRWKDVVILLRSPRGKAEAYFKEFNRRGVPFIAARGGFHDSAEARDLVALLQLLDNPLQDLPLLAVLLSPLAGLTAAELASIRIDQPEGRFWFALKNWRKAEEKKSDSPTARKAGLFLSRFQSWRRLSRRSAVSRCLESIVDETHYADWIGADERGEQRRGNVERFLHLARQFDGGRGESLPRFLRFLEAQQESEIDIEPASEPEMDAVRMMSIHQSKGLEFPVVVVADLGKKFNFDDLKQRIILDEKFGLCPQIKPPDAAQFYPSLAHWLARRRQKREILGEEMRLLYVAFTRAAQRLILAGSTSDKNIEENWPADAQGGFDDSAVLDAGNYLDWIGPWLAGTADLATSGSNSLLTWTAHEDQLAEEPQTQAKETLLDSADITPEIRDRVAWTYPFHAETELPAKASVSVLRRQIAEHDKEESARLFVFDTLTDGRPGGGSRLTAAEIGSAHHLFLESVLLERTRTVDELRAEAGRLARCNALTPTQAGCLDFEGLAAFWTSAVGSLLLKAPEAIRRELNFKARFAPAELARLGNADFALAGADEFVVVQGTIDLAAILPDEVWLLDFKTDQFPRDQLHGKIAMYRPQLELYAEAITRIYNRPVTRRWLRFLALQHTEELSGASS
jgi:ATP-dependent helicase/nuclease subunit A